VIWRPQSKETEFQMGGSRKRRLIGGAITILVLGVVGLVYAAWTNNSNGSGYAQAINGQGVSFASATTTAQLYPGGNGDLVLQLTNPNPYDIKVTKVERTASPTTSDAGAACDASTGVTVEDDTTLSFSIAASATQTMTLNDKVHMNNTSDTTCQGAKFTIPVKVTSVSDASNTSAGT
jgi:hypothetical protein